MASRVGKTTAILVTNTSCLPSCYHGCNSCPADAKRHAGDTFRMGLQLAAKGGTKVPVRDWRLQRYDRLRILRLCVKTHPEVLRPKSLEKPDRSLHELADVKGSTLVRINHLCRDTVLLHFDTSAHHTKEALLHLGPESQTVQSDGTTSACSGTAGERKHEGKGCSTQTKGRPDEASVALPKKSR